MATRVIALSSKKVFVAFVCENNFATAGASLSPGHISSLFLRGSMNANRTLMHGAEYTMLTEFLVQNIQYACRY